MTRLYLQAGCLLALLACAAMAADADKKQDSVAGAQQYGGEHGLDRYNHDGPADYEHHHSDHQGPADYEGDNYHHSDDHYFRKAEAKSFYLQLSSQDESDSPYTYKFRCAKESDAADYCLRTPHYGYDEHKRSDETDDLLSDIVLINDAAVCTAEFTEGTCPSSIPAWTLCERYVLNCTIGKQAEECGCPYPGGLKFTTTAYYLYNNATSCDSTSYVPPGGNQRRGLKAASYGGYNNNANITSGYADLYLASISYVQTSYGYKEVKGKLEFVYDWIIGPDWEGGRAAGRRAGARKGKTASYSDDESDYHHHHDDNEYYGHDDRYYEGAHHDGGYAEHPHPKNLVKGGNMKITLLEKEYY